jgi:tRNA A-37 threonylcarbamoyl transferase component Bud32
MDQFGFNSGSSCEWLSDDDFPQKPPYIVTSFLCNTQNDEAQIGVRCYDSCFYINMAPENFLSSPGFYDDYLHGLDAIKSDQESTDEIDRVRPEDFYIWALTPCLPLFEKLSSTQMVTLQDYFQSKVYHFDLGVVNHELVPLPSAQQTEIPQPGIRLPDEILEITLNWPSYLPSSIDLVISSAESEVCPNSSKVLINGKTTCFFKPYFAHDADLAVRELQTYFCITNSRFDLQDINIPQVHGIVRDDKGLILGLLLSYIDCNYVTLACASEPATDLSLKRRWVDQVFHAVTQLHNRGIVWGDAKPENVLIDANNDAWIVDFGGRCTDAFVNGGPSIGTFEGDIRGLAELVNFVFEEYA